MTFARWGNPTYKYGNTTRLYGAGTEDTNNRWIVMVDWDGDGVFDGTNEGVNMIDYTIRRGRDYFIRYDEDGKAEGFEHMKVGTARIVLTNHDGRYDPYNTASALYPNVLPGRYIKIQVNRNGTVYDRFAGKVKNIQPISGNDPKVIITAEDGMRLLQDYDASITVQQSIDIDDAIGQVLDDVDYPTIWGRNLEDATDILSYWWADDRAKTEIERLAEAELGTFFIAADGAATFYSRHHTNTALLTLTAADFLKEIDIPQPWEVVRNIIKVIAHPPVVEASQTLWTLADQPTLDAGASRTIWASYTYNNEPVSAINVVTPVATTDYLVNTQADGGGSNLTSAVTVTTFTNFGRTAKITLSSTSGSDGFITLEKVRGDAITFPDDSILIAEDTTSQGLYDKKTFTLDSPWLQSTELANDFSEYILSFLKDPQKFLTVILEGRGDIQFTPDLMDVIDLTVTKLGIDDLFKVGLVEEAWITDNGQAVRTTWRLEPFLDTSGYWIFTTQIGVTSIFGI